MRRKLGVLLAGLGMMCVAAPAPAHHSVTGEYDPDKKVNLKGVVTKIEWTNPHARIYMDVAQPDGSVVNWNLELAAVSSLVRSGWTSRSVKVGDTLTVEADLARSGVSGGHARSVILPDGRRVFSGIADN